MILLNRRLRATIPTHRLLEGGGFPVRRPAAIGSEMSPFLLLDEMGPVDWPPGHAIGAPAHPHRGFETVTYLLQGRMRHGDSAGHSGDLGPGDVQWMTAGRGVIHEELPHPDFKRDGGRMHGFQIWVNLPAKEKMRPPRYQDIPSTEIPNSSDKDGMVRARVIAGTCLGESAVIDTVIPVTLLHLTIFPGGSILQPIASELNAMIYCFDGSIELGPEDGTEPLLDGQLGLLTEGDGIRIAVPDEAEVAAEVLLLAGPSIDEPIARHGPFVMNTQAEIRQAIDDYHAGRLAAD